MDTELKRKLAAILVADVVGYSRLIATDEEATLRQLEVFRVLWQDCIGRTGGRIFNTAGDAILAEFQSAVEAVRCALDFQAQAKARNDELPPGSQMHFRVGITIGDVVERRGDLLGDGVNIAARLQTLAGPGGICVSSWVREAVANKIPVQFSDLGDQTVKNIPTAIRAYVVSAGAQAGKVAPTMGSASASAGWSSTNWKGLGVLLGLAATVALGTFMLLAQLRSPEPARDGEKRVVPVAATELPKETQTTREAPAAAPKPSVAIPVRVEPTLRDTAPKLPPAPTTQASTTTRPAPDQSVRLGVLDAAAEQALKPGDRFKECETCPEMIVIPRGEFTMGSNSSQPGHEPDEAPARKVVIGRTIAVARHATTVSEFATFVAVTGYRPGAGCRVFENGQWVERAELSFRNPGFQQVADHPAACVNWNDATAFADWMTARMNAIYRLPTEAEREYFTRAGTTTAFWWGNDIDPSRASYDWSHVFAGSPRAQPKPGTHPVDAFKPNPWGLMQVHGNVSEWVEDCWNDSYRGAPADGSAWTTGDCKRRVLRGGSWGYVPKDLRSAYREGATSTNRNFNFGFRLVRVLKSAM
jgi:formylglycine-generating enzyme required for sulfatase activity/class 3 adenylate cyclase